MENGPHLYLWNGTTFKTWRFPTQCRKAFGTTNGLYLNTMSTGLLHMEGGEFAPVCDDAWFRELDIRGVMPQADGRLLVATHDAGLVTVAGSTPTKIASAFDSIAVFNCTALPDGNIAVGTNGSGLLVINGSGELVDRFDAGSGLQQQQVVFPYFDQRDTFGLRSIKE